MPKSLFALLSCVLLVSLMGACFQTLAPVRVDLDPAGPNVSWVDDVAPILDRRCVVCHSCYNAPCQLKLSSYEGVQRGGSKVAVYDSARLAPVTPTRLFVDEQTTGGWRRRGFHSVTENRQQGDLNDSTMLHLLEAKLRHPVVAGTYESEATDLTCAADAGELTPMLARHPERGMPFGFPGLTPDEHRTLAAWLQQGALGPHPQQRRSLVTPGALSEREIATWEEFLNRDDPKHRLTARYLYEHFFLAHLHFRDGNPGEFYELLRSRTRPGEPIDVIATVRPYDDPGTGPMYYRFRKLHSTPVYKTHMVVEIGDPELDRIREQFIETAWLPEVTADIPAEEIAASPFLTFAQIPPKVRYQFLLDHSEYILRTFIRGPVCKGQVALNVIHDHFWVMFLDPEADATVAHPDFLIEQWSNLRMPIEEGSDEALLETFSNEYRERYAAFYQAKTGLYERVQPEGPALADVWPGNRAEDAPVLTVYRHFDSASVHKGLLGDLPRTLWVIDYSQFERIYYALVAGFDVFGNLSHQVNVRRYMDYLRIEGELNFLSFMPEGGRLDMLASWYIGDRAIENVGLEKVALNRPTRVPYETDDPKRELVERLVDGGHFVPEAGIAFDDVNYSRTGEEVPMPDSFETNEDILNGFRALTAPGTGFIRHVTDTGANVLLVRVRDFEGEDRMFSIVINRWHDNVNSMFLEGTTLDPSKDTIDFVASSVGSYPNYFLDLEGSEVPDLFDLLANFDGSEAYRRKLDAYGVNRSEPHFWEVYDWFQQRLDDADPLRAGLYDLNRYYREARPDAAF